MNPWLTRYAQAAAAAIRTTTEAARRIESLLTTKPPNHTATKLKAAQLLTLTALKAINAALAELENRPN